MRGDAQLIDALAQELRRPELGGRIEFRFWPATAKEPAMVTIVRPDGTLVAGSDERDALRSLIRKQAAARKQRTVPVVATTACAVVAWLLGYAFEALGGAQAMAELLR